MRAKVYAGADVPVTPPDEAVKFDAPALPATLKLPLPLAPAAVVEVRQT